MSECVLAEGALNEGGYGKKTHRGKQVLAHRAAWMKANPGKSIEGLHLHHLCGNPSCVNVEHLTLVTPAEHREFHPHGRNQNTSKQECINGHALTNENTYVRPDGKGRQCRECGRKRSQQWKESQRV